MTEAERIATVLEDQIQELKRVVNGYDFRPGHGGENIVGGLMIRADAPLDAPSIHFKCAFGAREKAESAKAKLDSFGIASTLEPPHRETMVDDEGDHVINTGVFVLHFSLPEGWGL